MLLFWTAAALLLLIAMAFILPPLLKTPAPENNSPVCSGSEAGREAHYRQRLQEIETEPDQPGSGRGDKAAGPACAA